MSVNALTSQGLSIEAQTDIITDLNNGFISIYGSDINLESNTPDGQMINIFAAAVEDQLQLLQSVYNSFSLQNAFGIQVDNLVALNGIQRQPGSYTQAYVSVTATQAVSLTGLNALQSNPAASVFTVSDGAGNQFQLVTTPSFSGAGTQSLVFQAIAIGPILTTANTITVIITPVVGISSVNNPSTAQDSIGAQEESDIQLKIRQAKSFKLAATGPADAIRAQLLNTPGIVDAFVADNDTSSIVNGIPANGIWVIVNNSTATPAQIAQAIYSKKTIGCAQKTSSGQSYNITRPAGNVFTAYWDLAVTTNLYISFTIQPINGVDTFNVSALAASLASALIYKLNQSAFVGQVINAMLTIAPNGYLTNIFVGTAPSPALQQVSPSDFQHYFIVLAANISIAL